MLDNTAMRRAGRSAPGLALVLLALLLPGLAGAERLVITPGREAEITALLAPHDFGDELAPGWTLHSFSVDRTTIHLWIAGPGRSYAELTLDHLAHGPEGARLTPSFALAVPARPPGSEAALATLHAALERNDDGSFWRSEAAYAEEDRRYPFKHGGSDRHFSLKLLREWAMDGLVLLTLFTIVLLVLVAHKLRGAAPWMKATLLAIVLGGAALRLLLSPAVGLEAWPYTRQLLSAALIYRGPGLALLHPEPAGLTEIILHSTLALALLAPLAVYVHARYLLDDHRAALIVAGIVAVLPLHLRFAHTDVAFIPSITVSSLLFTLIHVATREPSKPLGWFAVAVIGFPLALVYQVRPLNIMYFALLIATAFVHHGMYREKPRLDRLRLLFAFTVVTLVTALGGVPWLLASFGQQVSAGLSASTLGSALEVLLSPRMNALLNPQFTPPGLAALAVLGAVDLWRRDRRPLFYFLVLWLLGFLVAHAYVLPTSPYMQARYHLHLIVPFVLLAACGAEAALRWLATARPRAPWLRGRRYHAVIAALVLYVCASPLIHRDFIQTTELNDAREWLFVHALRDQIPEQCHIIEYTGVNAGARFERVGAQVASGVPRARWQVHELATPSPGAPEIPAEIAALLMDPPACLYWYEGLPCYSYKPLGADKAPVCARIAERLALEIVAETSFDSVVYDDNLARGIAPGARLSLTLARASRRPSG